MAKVLATQRAMNSRPAALTMAALLNGRAITIPKLYSTMGLAQLKTSVGNVAETALAVTGVLTLLLAITMNPMLSTTAVASILQMVALAIAKQLCRWRIPSGLEKRHP
tara:strand:+ start:322 stop:645 length:324 start_codon:yes stop_codon:yes gene_type:complete